MPLHQTGRAFDPREHPVRPARRRSAAAVKSRARQGAGDLPRRRQRGLRAARRGGVPDQPPGRAGAGGADRAHSPPRPPARSLMPSFPNHFHPGLPDLAGFPRDRWLRSLRAAWRRAPLDAVGYPDPRGVPALRQALAEYLGRVRGAAASPSRCWSAPASPRPSRCSAAGSPVAASSGWLSRPGLAPAPVDRRAGGPAGGAGPGRRRGHPRRRAEASDAGAVVVTPAHQFPTGAVLSRERRAALIECGGGRVTDRRGRLRFRAPLRRSGLGACRGWRRIASPTSARRASG